MPDTYAALMSSILESTVWDEDHATRIVWITLLAMKNKDGEVHASVPGIAHRARVSLEEAQAALEVFQRPDPWSRTPDHDGRRLEPIDGGWRVLNHLKYRDFMASEMSREAAKDRAKRYRDRRRDASRPVTPRNGTARNQDQDQDQLRTTLSGKPDGTPPRKRPESPFPCPDCAQVIAHLNRRIAKSYDPDSKTCRKLLHARHRESSVDACLDIVDYLADKWQDDPKMQQYLRPATLFNARVFEGHYADLQAEAKKTHG